jgi:hypothetical protein
VFANALYQKITLYCGKSAEVRCPDTDLSERLGSHPFRKGREMDGAQPELGAEEHPGPRGMVSGAAFKTQEGLRP